MLGGYQIINLSNIDLTIGTSQVSITGKGVLAQLRELREHIEDNYNFVIPLNRKLKPVLLRLRDKKNGEKQEVSVWANLSIITNNKTFKIEALVDSVSMKVIQIEVVFQQLTDDDGNPYWDIKTAKYLYTENIGISGDLAVTGAISGASATLPIINGEENPSVKPIYWHTLHVQRGVGVSGTWQFDSYFIILTNNSELLTLNDFLALLNTDGFYAVAINGVAGGSTGALADMTYQLVGIENSGANVFKAYIRDKTSNVVAEVDNLNISTQSITLFEDLGSNKIN